DEAVIERFVEEVTNAGLLKMNESHIGFAAPLATHGGTGRTGGPQGELHYPILRTSHMQGAAIVPSGTYTPARLAEEVGLPERAAAWWAVLPANMQTTRLEAPRSPAGM